MRNKKHFNKLTSLHVNDELHVKATSLAKAEDKYFYEVVDELLKEYIKNKEKR